MSTMIRWLTYSKSGYHVYDEEPANTIPATKFIEYSAYESIKAEHEKFCADAQEKTDRDFALVIAANDKLTKERDEARAIQDECFKTNNDTVKNYEKWLSEARAREKHWHEYSLKAFKVSQESDAKAQKLVEACEGLKLRRSLDDMKNVIEALAEYSATTPEDQSCPHFTKARELNKKCIYCKKEET